MEKFYLEKPSVKRKAEIIDYVNELDFYNSDINGIEIFARNLKNDTFEHVLEHSLNLENEDYAKSLGKAQMKTFLLIRKEDDRVVGSLNIRWNFLDKGSCFSGNIGYGIRPTEREKGYNKINLYLGLIESQKIGLDKVKLVCEANNLGSVKTIEALGGDLERTEVDLSDGVLTSVYNIDVKQAIEKNKSYL